MSQTHESAFPRPYSLVQSPTGWVHYPAQDGMKLRDWFAGMALTGMLANANWRPDFSGGLPDSEASILVHYAYKAAEAMLRRRQRELKPAPQAS